MFINFSNHPSEWWDENQKKAALKWNEIVNVPFPTVKPDADETEIASVAEDMVDVILSYNPDVVMCQGEFTLCFAVVKLLKERGILTVAACAERNVREIVDSAGNCKKETVFRFERFREYL